MADVVGDNVISLESVLPLAFGVDKAFRLQEEAMADALVTNEEKSYIFNMQKLMAGGNLFENIHVETAGPCVLKQGEEAHYLILGLRGDAFQGPQDGCSL